MSWREAACAVFLAVLFGWVLAAGYQAGKVKGELDALVASRAASAPALVPRGR